MSPAELDEAVAELRRLRGPGAPEFMIASLAVNPRLSFASMSDCMAIGISGGCGLTCPVLHAGGCDVAEDFREDAKQVLARLEALALVSPPLSEMEKGS